MSKTTPGPWKWDFDEPTLRYGRLRAEGDITPIVEANENMGRPTPLEARLIAAAPELLQVLCDALEHPEIESKERARALIKRIEEG